MDSILYLFLHYRSKPLISLLCSLSLLTLLVIKNDFQCSANCLLTLLVQGWVCPGELTLFRTFGGLRVNKIMFCFVYAVDCKVRDNSYNFILLCSMFKLNRILVSTEWKNKLFHYNTCIYHSSIRKFCNNKHRPTRKLGYLPK